MNIKQFTTAALLTLLVASCAPAYAQAPAPECSDRDKMVAAMQSKYKEAPHVMGLITPGDGLMEIWGNLETGTWPATITNSDKLMCVVAFGKAFTVMDGKLPPQGEDM